MVCRGRRLVEDEIELVVGRVLDRPESTRGPSLARGRSQRDAVVLQLELAAFHLDREFRAAAFDFELQRHAQLSFAALAR